MTLLFIWIPGMDPQDGEMDEIVIVIVIATFFYWLLGHVNMVGIIVGSMLGHAIL